MVNIKEKRFVIIIVLRVVTVSSLDGQVIILKTFKRNRTLIYLVCVEVFPNSRYAFIFIITNANKSSNLEQ
jgi:hypothetical protein